MRPGSSAEGGEVWELSQPRQSVWPYSTKRRRRRWFAGSLPALLSVRTNFRIQQVL